MKDIARLALHHIHRHQIIHNDVHECNVMVSGNNTPVVIDFGKATIAKAVRSNNGIKYKFQSQEERDAYQKKYGWIAPELLNYAAAPSPQTDAYSFGFLLTNVDRATHHRWEAIAALITSFCTPNGCNRMALSAVKDFL